MMSAPAAEYVIRNFQKKSISGLYAPGISYSETDGCAFESIAERSSLRIVFDGRSDFESQWGKWSLNPNNAVFIAAGTRNYNSTPSGRKTCGLSIYFSDDELCPALLKGLSGSPIQMTRDWLDGCEIQIKRLLEISASPDGRVNEARQNQACIARALQDTLLAESELADRLDVKRPTTRKRLTEQLKNAKSIIDQRAVRAVNLDSVAADCGMSRFHFTTLFTRAFGTSPRNYHLSRRMYHAAELLTHFPVSDVAHQVGYKNVSSFSRAFKNVHGISPINFAHADQN